MATRFASFGGFALIAISCQPVQRTTPTGEAHVAPAPPVEAPLVVVAPAGEKTIEETFAQTHFAIRRSSDGWKVVLANYPISRYSGRPMIDDWHKVRVGFEITGTTDEVPRLPPAGRYPIDPNDGVKGEPLTPGTIHDTSIATFYPEMGSEMTSTYYHGEGFVEIHHIDEMKLELTAELDGGDWRVQGRTSAVRPPRPED